jgi:modulator of FtsH protease
MDTRNNPIIIDGNQPRAGFGGAQTQAAPALLSQVLLITSLGFFVSAFGVYLAPFFFGMGPALIWVCAILSFMLIFAVRATRRNPPLSLVIFLSLALVLGFEIAPIIQVLLHAGRSAVVFNAAITTAVGMAVLGMGAQLARFNYRRIGGIAIGALFALIIIGILGAFFHYVSPTFYSWATLAIFSVLILVDFMRIRNGGDGATAVELALSIYLDGLNVFLALLRIFGGRRD